MSDLATINQDKKSNLSFYVLYGMVYELIFRLYNPYQVKFLERIGGNDFDISLFNSLPGLVMVFTTLPAIYIMRNLASQKMTGYMLILQRFFILLYATVPLYPLGYQPLAFIIITAIMSIPYTLYINGFQSLTAELFPPEDRAVALSMKSRYSVVVIMAVTFVTGQILTNLPHSDHQRIFFYQLFFVTAFLLTFLELHVLRRLKPSQKSYYSAVPFKKVLKEIFNNRPYLLFISCSLLFHFGWQMGWPLFSIYTIKNLGADEHWLAIISISSMTTMFLGHIFWPRWIKRFGNPTVIAICTMGMSVTPIMYIISKDLYTLTLMATITGIFTSGTLTVLLNSLLDVIPVKNRMIYMGVYTTLTNLTLSVAPILGHHFLSTNSIQFALLMSALFRTLGGISFIARNIWLKRQASIRLL